MSPSENLDGEAHVRCPGCSLNFEVPLAQISKDGNLTVLCPSCSLQGQVSVAQIQALTFHDVNCQNCWNPLKVHARSFVCPMCGASQTASAGA